jgi:acyl-CoA thioesterase
MPDLSNTPFPDLRATEHPHRWVLPVTPNVCVGPPSQRFLFGGLGLATAMQAMEQTCGRPVVWATAQFLSYARMPAVLDIDVAVEAQGTYNSQARAVGRIADRKILTVHAALGERPGDLSGQWEEAPNAPPPEACSPIAMNAHTGGELHSALEIRTARGRFGFFSEAPVSGDGHVLVWMRIAKRPVDAIALTIMADFVPSVTSNALGFRVGGNSLDNTIRICRIVETEWVLCDIAVDGLHGGFGHGRMNLFAQDGTLMAMASQSFILRTFGHPTTDATGPATPASRETA